MAMTEHDEAFNPEPGEYRLDPAPRTGQDIRDGAVYVLDKDSILAIRVALATNRALLISGPPGSGKSSLAAFVARYMKWNYFEQVVTSRTRAQDLKWHFDAVARLRDAQTIPIETRFKVRRRGSIRTGDRRSKPMEAYLEPRVLWWAINPDSARRRGLPEALAMGLPEPSVPGHCADEPRRSVVLIDEIDKADPDVPNDLLVALGSLEFHVKETGQVVRLAENAPPPLVMMTTNKERALPRAFLRRCVTLKLELPDAPERLAQIAETHFPPDREEAMAPLTDKAFRNDAGDLDQACLRELYLAVAARSIELRASAQAEKLLVPGTAEYLDAVRACLRFGVVPGDDSDEWHAIERATFEKPLVS